MVSYFAGSPMSDERERLITLRPFQNVPPRPLCFSLLVDADCMDCTWLHDCCVATDARNEERKREQSDASE